MATIEIPKVRKESTIIMYVSLTDNGVTVDWTSLSEIKPFMYSDEQHCIAGKCTAEIVTGSPETLIVRYPTTAPQFLGQNSLLIRCTYDGNEKSFDVPVLEFVDRSSEATGVTVIEDPELPVAIEVQDVDTSVLDDAIAAALDAAAKATAAAELVPLDILAQCQAAAEAATAAAENASPRIAQNGNWEIYDFDEGEYVDSGNPSRGIQGVQGEKGDKGDKGDQGNTGSSVAYPYELVNNLTTDDATKGLSAAQGVALAGEISQLDQKVDDLGDTLQDEIDAITPIVIEGDVTNAPDEEDITTDSNNLLKFKNRVAGVGQMGYKILRKDASFASQVTDTNTIYEIRYPFNLNGATVNIPAGCVLRFNGGKLANGTLEGNETEIDSGVVEIFDGITIGGTWKVSRIYSKWFADDNKTVENALALNNANINTEILIDGDYDMLVEHTGMFGPNILGNTVVKISGTLSKASGSTLASSMLEVVGNNVAICGGVIDGKKSLFSVASEYGQGIIAKSGAHNVIIDGVKVKDCRGDGIYIGGTTAPEVGVIIRNCEVTGCRRNGITIIWGENVLIENTYIHDIAGAAPEAAIDVEPNNATQLNKNITISNCRITACTYGLAFSGTNAKITDVVVENTQVVLDNYRYGLIYTVVENALFLNCDFVLSGTKAATYSISSGSGGTNKNINFVGCRFVSTATTGQFLTGSANYFGCYFALSGESLADTLSGKYIGCSISCKGLCNKGGSSGFILESCTIVSSDGSTLSGTAAAPAQGVVIRNSRLTINATYYPFNMTYVKDFLFENNIMTLVGNRALFNVQYGENLRFNHNRVILGSNQNGVVIYNTCTNCQVKDNTFEIADGVTYTAGKVVGINAVNTATNKVGDPFYAGGKMVVYNGTSVVNVDGTALS